MLLRKLVGIAALLMAVALSACNLSLQAGAAAEVALDPPTLEIRPTRTPISFDNPTAISPTQIALAAPTITILGGGAASQVVNVSGGATQSPPAGICSVKPTGSYDVNVRLGPGAEFGIVTALRSGQYAPVLSRAAAGWMRIDLGIRGQGWVSPKVVTLFGPCDNLPRDEGLSSPGIQASRVEPGLTPTPTGLFGFTMNIPLNHIVTKVTVGSIPAGTTVMITTSMFTGSEYLYDIMTVDGRYEKARESQLAYSETGGLLPFPTSTPYVFVPTPTAVFDTEIGMGQFRVVTTTQVGDIPAGTTVRIGSAMYNGKNWTYDISTKDEIYATASESQLTYIPNAGGGGPTPTVPVTLTAAVPVMNLPPDVSPSDVVIPDGLCTVTAKTATQLVATPGSSTVVGVLNPGPWAQVSAKNGQGWYKVTIWVDGSQGWANASSLTLYGQCASLPVE